MPSSIYHLWKLHDIIHAMEYLKARAYLTREEWRGHVEAEAGEGTRSYGRLILAPGRTRLSFWAQNTWLEPFVFRFSSISEAASRLKSLQRNWWPCSWKHHGKTRLIQEALPFISDKPRDFPFSLPDQPMGGWILLDEETILASAACSSPFAGGELALKENKSEPPSSAYLKLQEALVRFPGLPGKGDSCIDAGACPGGWTWVLLGLGASVLAVDRSPLDPRLQGREGLEFRKGNAFSLRPEDFDHVDWLCSDVICYPGKLLEWAQAWLDSGKARNLVLTIKMQGEPDPGIIRAFADIPGSTVYHGSYNKHELTWIRPDPSDKI